MIISGNQTLAERRARMEVEPLWFCRVCLTLPGGNGHANLLERIESVIAGADRHVALHFERAAVFRRTDPDLGAWATQVPLTAARMDELFSRAMRMRRKHNNG